MGIQDDLREVLCSKGLHNALDFDSPVIRTHLAPKHLYFHLPLMRLSSSVGLITLDNVILRSTTCAVILNDLGRGASLLAAMRYIAATAPSVMGANFCCNSTMIVASPTPSLSRCFA